MPFSLLTTIDFNSPKKLRHIFSFFKRATSLLPAINLPAAALRQLRDGILMKAESGAPASPPPPALEGCCCPPSAAAASHDAAPASAGDACDDVSDADEGARPAAGGTLDA